MDWVEVLTPAGRAAREAPLALKRPLFPTLDPNEVKAHEIRTEARERLAALADIERTLAEARQLHAEMAQRLMQRRNAIANSLHQWKESTADLFWAFEQSFSRHPMMRR